MKTPVALGLSGIADWEASQPFLDAMRSSREWQGRSASQWSSHSTAQLRAGGHLDADGWPIRIPPGANRVGTIILCEIAAADTSLNGRYRMEWAGEGTVALQGGQNLTRGPNWLEFDYVARGGNMVLVELTRIEAANPIRAITCVRTDRRAAFAAGAVFRPEWLEVLRGFGLLRFMDWMATNNSPVRRWQDRPRPGAASYGPGVPVEVMVALCNQLGADPWFCLPHLADDDYITRFATHVRDHLRPDLNARFEYSNEVWNWQFEQAQWANRQALAAWPDLVNSNGWVQYYGGRAAEMAIILDRVYAGQRARYTKVIATQIGYRGIERGLLDAPRWVAMQPGRRAPSHYFDAYAVTGYFDGGMNSAEAAGRIATWRSTQGDEAAMTRVYEQMLDARHWSAGGSVTAQTALWRYQKAVADRAELALVMYEGGSHVVADHGALDRDPGLLGFLERFHYSAHMGALYERAMRDFRAAGGQFFNVFVEMARVGRHGIWGARRHALDDNPRWRAIAAFNAEGGPVQPPVTPPVQPPVTPPVAPGPDLAAVAAELAAMARSLRDLAARIDPG